MRKTLRAVFVALIALVALAAVPEHAEALPPGVYVLGCHGGRWQLVDLIGNVVWSGPCDSRVSNCDDRWLYKVTIEAHAVQPTTSPSDSPNFEGKDAAYWIRFINTFQADNSGGRQDPTEFLSDAPTLDCGTGDITLGDGVK